MRKIITQDQKRFTQIDSIKGEFYKSSPSGDIISRSGLQKSIFAILNPDSRYYPMVKKIKYNDIDDILELTFNELKNNNLTGPESFLINCEHPCITDSYSADLFIVSTIKTLKLFSTTTKTTPTLSILSNFDTIIEFISAMKEEHMCNYTEYTTRKLDFNNDTKTGILTVFNLISQKIYDITQKTRLKRKIDTIYTVHGDLQLGYINPHHGNRYESGNIHYNSQLNTTTLIDFDWGFNTYDQRIGLLYDLGFMLLSSFSNKRAIIPLTMLSNIEKYIDIVIENTDLENIDREEIKQSLFYIPLIYRQLPRAIEYSSKTKFFQQNSRSRINHYKKVEIELFKSDAILKYLNL